jgi:hypothetical protein
MSSTTYVKQSEIEKATGYHVEDYDTQFQQRYKLACVVRKQDGTYRLIYEKNSKGFYEPQIDVIGYDVDGKDVEVPDMHAIILRNRQQEPVWVKLRE